MTIERTYTQEQLDIALLKQQSGATTQALSRIENELISIDTKLESKIDRLDSRIDSHFKWTLTLFFGLYVSVVGTAIGFVIKNSLA